MSSDDVPMQGNAAPEAGGEASADAALAKVPEEAGKDENDAPAPVLPDATAEEATVEPSTEQEKKAPDRDGALRDTRPAWMTQGVGVGTKMLGEATGDLVKPGMTKAQFEELQKRGVPDGPDPFGDVFREKKPTGIDELGFEEDVKPGEVSEQKPIAPETPATEDPVFIAGRKFHNRAELMEYIKTIQDRHADDDGTGGYLTLEDSIFMFHLMLHHPLQVSKMRSPLAKIRYGLTGVFTIKCFTIVSDDGTEVGISASKSAVEAFKRGEQTPGGLAIGGATGSTSRGDVSTEAAQGSKREREPEPEATRPERVFLPVNVKHSVVDIKGVSASATINWLKEYLSEYGRVRYVEILKGPARDSEKAAPKDNSDEPSPKRARKDEEKAEEEGEDAEKKEEVKEKKGEKDAAVATEASVESSKVPKEAVDADKQESTPMEEDQAAEGADETKTPEEECDDDTSDVAEDKAEFVTARIRFDDAKMAKKALEELKEIKGSKVEVGLLSPADETDYWERTNVKLKEMFDNPSKGKGKKGKGKGKSKGKGKGKGKKW